MMKSNYKKTIAILFGGKSPEHEVSILTGLQVLHALDASKYNILPIYVCESGKFYTGKKLFNKDFFNNLNFKKLKKFKFNNFDKNKIDIYFPCFHGSYGENGSFQGFFEILNKPYVGPGVLASSIGMSKSATKQICKANKIPVLDYILLKNQKNYNIKFDFPVIIKPNNLGSSIGISFAKNKHELQLAIAGAFIFDTQVLVESKINNLLEINCSVFNNKISNLEEPKKNQDFLSFEQKYLKGSKNKSQGMASMQRIIDPKSINNLQKMQIIKYTKKIYKALDGSGVWRIDFLINKNNNKIYLNEINTIPGSLAYYLWDDFTELLNKLIISAIKKFNKKNKINLKLERRIFNA